MLTPLDLIIQSFNDRFFSAWDATSEEKRVKLVNILEHVKNSKEYESQVLNNHDAQNRRLALESLIGKAINKERSRELELYKLYATDPDFKKAFHDSLIRILNLEEEEGKSA